MRKRAVAGAGGPLRHGLELASLFSRLVDVAAGKRDPPEHLTHKRERVQLRHYQQSTGSRLSGVEIPMNELSERERQLDRRNRL